MGLLNAPDAGEDAGLRALVRRVADLETQLQQVMAASAGNAGQLDFLANQSASAEAAPGALTTVTINPATSNVPITWIAFDPAADAQVELTTSSTGRLAVTCGGFLLLTVTLNCRARAGIGVEILKDGVVVRNPGIGDGNLTDLRAPDASWSGAGSGHRHEWTLAPLTTYTVRCRRGYSVGAGSAGAVATISFQGTAVSATKLGM